MMLLFGVSAIYASGYMIRRIVFYKNSTLLSPPEKVGLDIGFGSGTLALAFFYTSLSGISLTRANMMLVAFIFIAASMAIKLHDMRKRQFSRKMSFSKIGWTKVAFLIIIGMSVSVIFFKSLFYPMNEWMSRSIFGIKAKVLYESKTVYDKDLLDKEFLIEHPEYPLLVPMLEDWLYNCRNSSDDRFGKAFLPFLAVGFLCSIYAIQRKFCPSRHSLVFTALYATVYVFVYRISYGEADAPLAFYYFCAGVYMLLWIHFKIYAYLISASLFTAIAMFTKLEASSFFLIISAALFAALIFDKKLAARRKILAFFSYAVPVLVLVAPWMLYKRMLPTVDVFFTDRDILNPQIFDTIFKNCSRIPVVLSNFVFDIMLKTRKWNLFWVIFFAAQLFSFKELFKRPVSYLAFMVWSTLALYLLMFVTTYVEPAHMFVTMDRLALQVSGLALLLISLLTCKNTLVTDALS